MFIMRMEMWFFMCTKSLWLALCTLYMCIVYGNKMLLSLFDSEKREIHIIKQSPSNMNIDKETRKANQVFFMYCFKWCNKRDSAWKNFKTRRAQLLLCEICRVSPARCRIYQDFDLYFIPAILLFIYLGSKFQEGTFNWIKWLYFREISTYINNLWYKWFTATLGLWPGDVFSVRWQIRH